MRYLCSRCHHEFAAESAEGLACPNCGAEAGLEPEHGIPPAMKMFGMLLTGVAVLAIGGGILSRIIG